MNIDEVEFRSPLPEELAPHFPSYQILSLIAKGGMGSVYHAIQTSLEREIAIKILPVEFGADPEFCKGFEAEAKAMAKLNHPNLISVFDFGEVNGMLFIAMEYVPGQSLYEACNGSALAPAEVVRFMTGICQGLAHAHGHGILHRDIKPANILLDSSRQPKIGDFGLARPLDVKVQHGETIFGTPGYTAPEVVEHPLTVDQRADIFSLGVLLHELLTGLLPASDPRPPSVISNCDPRFDEVVRKATHPNPILRYQNAAEIADSLQKIGNTSGPKVMRTASSVPPRPPATQRHFKKSAQKNSSGFAFGLTLVVAMVGLFIFRDQIFQNTVPNQDVAVVVDPIPEPAIPRPVVSEPTPVDPAPAQVAPIPIPVEPEPVQVADVTEPVEPKADPVASEPEATRLPKFDVEGFLVHARSIMVGRCSSYIIKHNDALIKNLTDFRSDALKLILENLPANFHAAAERELDDFVAKQKGNGNRMGENLERPLKFKPYLVDLHTEYQQKEKKIDEEMIRVVAEPQKTYLYGLGIKLKALQESDDPAAADLVKAEIDRVKESPSYFPSLMKVVKKD